VSISAGTARQQSLSPEALELVQRIQQFLYHEAECMDHHRYGEWLALWTDELQYWVPADPDDPSPRQRVALIFDDRKRLEERIYRWDTGYAHAQIPRPRLSRAVTNVRLVGEDDGRLVVRSTFTLTFARRTGLLDPPLAMSTYAGDCEHHLEATDVGGAPEFRIARKTVRLLNAYGPMYNLQFLL
jgi:benzoate/toluate 1,2-dioxygenase subunit beta